MVVLPRCRGHERVVDRAASILEHRARVQMRGRPVYAVTHATREEIEAAPEYMALDRASQAPAGVAQPPAPVATQQPAAPVAAPQPAAPVAPQPVATPERPRVGIAQPQEGFATVDWTTLSVEQLRQAEVYDVNDERVSGITD